MSTSPFRTSGLLPSGAAERLGTFVRILPSDAVKLAGLKVHKRGSDGVQRIAIGSDSTQVQGCFDFRGLSTNLAAGLDDQLYVAVGSRAVGHTLEGFNSCILAYSTAKKEARDSFIFNLGNVETSGNSGVPSATPLSERCICDLFDRLESPVTNAADFSSEVHLELFEAMGSRAYDLLGGVQSPLKVESSGAVVGLRRIRCGTSAEAIEHVKMAVKTYIARQSTRQYHGDNNVGHLVLRLSISQIKSRQAVCTSDLLLVQFSASASVGTSSTFRDSVSRALASAASGDEHTNSPAAQAAIVSACMQQIDAGIQPGAKKGGNVMSKVLGQGLGGDCKTSMVVTLSTAEHDRHTAMGSLLFLELARHILNAPVNRNVNANEAVSDWGIGLSKSPEPPQVVNLSSDEVRGNGPSATANVNSDAVVVASAVREAEQAREQLAAFRESVAQQGVEVDQSLQESASRIIELEGALRVAVTELKAEREKSRETASTLMKYREEATLEIENLRKSLDWERKNSRKIQYMIESKRDEELQTALEEQDSFKSSIEERLLAFGQSAESELRQMQDRMNKVIQEREALRHTSAAQIEAMRRNFESKVIDIRTAERQTFAQEHNELRQQHQQDASKIEQLQESKATLERGFATQSTAIANLEGQVEDLRKKVAEQASTIIELEKASTEAPNTSHAAGNPKRAWDHPVESTWEQSVQPHVSYPTGFDDRIWPRDRSAFASRVEHDPVRTSMFPAVPSVRQRPYSTATNSGASPNIQSFPVPVLELDIGTNPGRPTTSRLGISGVRARSSLGTSPSPRRILLPPTVDRQMHHRSLDESQITSR